MEKIQYPRNRRNKPEPKYGKYIYEYIINFENGIPVSVKGKNKYLIVYEHARKILFVNKSNGCVPFSPSFMQSQKIHTLHSIEEYLKHVYEIFSFRNINCKTLFSLDNISCDQLETFIKNGDKQRQLTVLENRLQGLKQKLYKLNQEENEIKETIKETKKNIHMIICQKKALEDQDGETK